MDQIDDTEYEDALSEMEEESKPRKKKKKKEPSATKLIDIEDKERILLAQLLNNSELFIKGITFLEKEFFESKINILIVEFIKE